MNVLSVKLFIDINRKTADTQDNNIFASKIFAFAPTTEETLIHRH